MTTIPETVNLVDLDNAVRIIDAACQRGAFRGEEMTNIGAVRDKIARFVKNNAPVADTESQTTEEIPEEKE